MTSPQFLLRLATPADAAAIHAIYAPIVRDTIISFELDPPDVVELQALIADVLTRNQWLCAVRGDTVLGYAYACAHRSRAAYQWAVDVSVYVHADARRLGVGRRLSAVLLRALRELGYWQAFAGIALPNPASVALHERVGFRPLGVYRAVGYKLGAWRDVGWWQCALQPAAATTGTPPPPRPLAQLLADPAWPQLLARGE